MSGGRIPVNLLRNQAIAFHASVYSCIAEKAALFKKITSLDELNRFLAHEIRIPLTSVNGYVRLLNRPFLTRLDENGKTLLNGIISKVGLLIEMMGKMGEIGNINRPSVIETEIRDSGNGNELVPRTPKSQEQLNALEAENRMLAMKVDEMVLFNHELPARFKAPVKELLNDLIVFSEKYSGQLDDVGRDYLQTVVKNATFLKEVILDTLFVLGAKPQDIVREKVDMSRLMTDLIKREETKLNGRKVDFVIKPNLSAICDIHAVRPALYNMLKNAIKYSEKHPTARIEFGYDDKKGAFFVKDDGAGFDPAKAVELFKEIGHRLHTKKQHEGSGLGQMIIQKAIEVLQGGQVWAESDGPEKGATFYFTLGPA